MRAERSLHVCEVAIVCDPAHAPWKCAKPLYENQIDFNYIDWPTLLDARVDANAVTVGPMTYRHVIVEGEVPQDVESKLATFAAAGHLTRYSAEDAEYVSRITSLIGRDVTIQPPSPAIRIRHVIRDGRHFYMLFNERKDAIEPTITFATRGQRFEIDPATGKRAQRDAAAKIRFAAHELKLFEITTEDR